MEFVDDSPVPNGMIWNMVYDANAPEGFIPPCSHEEIWERLQYFLNAIIPVAEEAGVTLAAHPDDPPLPFLKQTPRLIYQPELYQKLLDLYPSKSNQLEYCLGTLSEMTEGDIYEATNQYSKQGKIGYIHFRNVMGKAPSYKEVFVDEGDVDMIRILKILKKNNFKGVLIPDHTPQINCDAPWYAGMAFAMGYMKAALKLIDKDES
jgi:mannonate dehydratase